MFDLYLTLSCQLKFVHKEEFQWRELCPLRICMLKSWLPVFEDEVFRVKTKVKEVIRVEPWSAKAGSSCEETLEVLFSPHVHRGKTVWGQWEERRLPSPSSAEVSLEIPRNNIGGTLMALPASKKWGDKLLLCGYRLCVVLQQLSWRGQGNVCF